MERSLFREGQFHPIRHRLFHFHASTVGRANLCVVSDYHTRRTEFMDLLISHSHYAPQFFQSIGYNAQKTSLLASGIYGVVKVRIPDAP